MRRLTRFRFVLLAATLLAAVGMSTHFVTGKTGLTVLPRQFRGSGRVADLKSQLESGLRARRPKEFKFIADVVKLVETKKLPVEMVVETFHYARHKRPYPFQYFQRALAIRAVRFGVTLKPV